MKPFVRLYLLSALVFAGLYQAGFLPVQAAQNASAVRPNDAKRAYKAAMEQADQKIYEEVKEHSELMKNLEHLTTQIGPRLTGSKQMQQASDWTLSVRAASRTAMEPVPLSSAPCPRSHESPGLEAQTYNHIHFVHR